MGLNSIPNARMDTTGTVRTGISTLIPYSHAYIGLQIAKPLYINIRQSAQTSNITSKAKNLSPGIDIKLRLLKESTYIPAIALGMQSTIGNKRMAGEYIALSKKYNNFDFTAGLGWGKYGSSNKFSNPLKYINSHFDKRRDTSLSKQNTLANWFSGDTIGFFSGVEYFTNLKGLSIKLDYGSNKNIAERLINPNIKKLPPWGIGISYTHNKWLNASIGTQGTGRVFAQISLKANPSKWGFSYKKYKNPKPFYKTRPQSPYIEEIAKSTKDENINISNIYHKDKSIYADLNLTPKAPAPKQIGRATRNISMSLGKDIEEINITPISQHLRGNTIKIMRSDIEKYINNNGSPQEIWNNIDFTNNNKSKKQNPTFKPSKTINNKLSFALSLDNQISLSEPDTGILYKSSTIIEAKTYPYKGFITGLGLRLNLADNLDNIPTSRIKYLNPVRSDVNDFTQKRLSLENAYIGYTHSITPEIHTSITAGYLEEFYNGAGAEILYRPFKSRLAIGAEIWSIKRRNPQTLLNLGLNTTDITTTGFVNAWYDFTEQNLTLSTKIGRFLAGDTGISLGLNKTFKNGAKLSAITTLSNYKEIDKYGNETSAYHSISLTLPLGSIPHITEGSEIRTKIAPFARDIGQTLNKPLKLFEMTEAFTLNHMSNNWLEIMD